MNQRNYTKEVIIEKVKKTGVTDQIYERGSTIARFRVFKKVIEKLDEHDKSQVEGKPTDIVMAFFERNPGKLFFLTDEEIQSIEDATWEEYFS